MRRSIPALVAVATLAALVAGLVTAGDAQTPNRHLEAARKEGRIVVKRSQLRSVAEFAGTVLHELCHALSSAPDLSFVFEEKLTKQLGTVVAKGLSRRASSTDPAEPS